VGLERPLAPYIPIVLADSAVVLED
jgi:hypothetical protein